MISIEVKDNESLDRAIKRFKKKFEKAGVLKEVRGRNFFEKKSVLRRHELIRAAYREKMRSQSEL